MIILPNKNITIWTPNKVKKLQKQFFF